MLPSFHSLLHSNSILAAVYHRVQRLPFIQSTCDLRFMSSYYFYSVFPVFIVQLCLQTKCFSTRFSFHSFLLCVAENEQRAALTSLHKDFGMRQGGSQELLSTGGIMAGQPPAGGGGTRESNRAQDVFKGIQQRSSVSAARSCSKN